MEDKYQAIFESTPNPVFRLDRSGRIQEMNRAAAELIHKAGDAGGKGKIRTLTRLLGELRPFLAGSGAELVFEKDIQAGEDRTYEICARRLPGPDREIAVFMHDRTRWKKAEAELKESEEKLRAISQTAADAIISVDGAGRIIFWNDAAERIFGYASGEIMGRSLAGIMPERLWVRHQKRFRSFIRGEKPTIIGRTVELAARRKGGEEFPIELSLSYWKTGKDFFFTGIVRDITERKHLLDEIQRVSITDQLTGLLNRRGFYAFSERQLLLATRRLKGFLIFYADLDGLKWINDRLGHQAGDQALMDAADVLNSTFRRTDIIARLGGDEFLILAIDSAEKDGAYFTARLEKNIQLQNKRNLRKYTLSISAGHVFWDPKSPRSLDELISEADTRMYREKFRRRKALHPVAEG